MLLTFSPSLLFDTDSIWLLIILAILTGILFSYSSRINNLEHMVSILNEKVNNLVEKIKEIERNKLVINHDNKHNDPTNIPGPFNEENLNKDHNAVIDSGPKISKLFDPRQNK